MQVALSASIHLDLGTTLLFSGLYNVLSGVGFRIPMCVQVRSVQLCVCNLGWVGRIYWMDITLHLRVCHKRALCM
jgi:hypothetical protein